MQKVFYSFFLLLALNTLIAEEIRWITNYQQAVGEAIKSGKPVLIDFYAPW